MNKENLIALVSRETDCGKLQVSRIIEATINRIINAVARGEKVHISGFGTFEPKERAARVGRDLNTNTAYPIPARTLPVFTPLPGFKDEVASRAENRAKSLNKGKK